MDTFFIMLTCDKYTNQLGAEFSDITNLGYFTVEPAAGLTQQFTQQVCTMK